MKLFINSKIIMPWIMLSICAHAMENPQPILKHKQKDPKEVYQPLDNAFVKRPVIQVNALLEQDDSFSCAYRTLFHALCMQSSIRKAKRGISFETSLKEELGNIALLNKVHAHVSDYLRKYDEKFDRATGLRKKHLIGVCLDHFPSLSQNILHMEVESNNFYVLHDAMASESMPLAYSSDFALHYETSLIPQELGRVKLDESRELLFQLNKLSYAYTPTLFACYYPGHVFLASMMSDKNKKAILYVIDSNNVSIHAHEQMQCIVNKLLTYVEEFNNRGTKKRKLH